MVAESFFSFFVLFIVLAITIFIIRLFFEAIYHAFEHIGFSRIEISLILFGVLIGALINIPLFQYNNWIVAANLGGTIIPLIICAEILYKKRIPAEQVLIGIVFVAFPAYWVTSFDPAIGIVSPFPLWLIPPLMASIISLSAFWHEEKHAAPLAYVAGTIGIVLGADLMRLPEVLAHAPAAQTMASIGGAGLFDMVFLTGIIAVAIDATLIRRKRKEDMESIYELEKSRNTLGGFKV